MFIKRETYGRLKYDLATKNNEISDLNRNLEITECNYYKLEDEKKILENELEKIVAENRLQHEKILKITNRLKKPMASMKDYLELKNDLLKILSNKNMLDNINRKF